MIEVENSNISIKKEFDNHVSIWFPINAFLDLKLGKHMVDCSCLRCRKIVTFNEEELLNMSNCVHINLGVIVPLSTALDDYASLSECYKEHSDVLKDSNQDKIICKVMKKRYSNRY